MAVVKNAMDFPAMIESAIQKLEAERELKWQVFEEELNDDIILAITDIVAIVDTFATLIKELPKEEEKCENQVYSVSELQTMRYDPRTYSGPAYVEFPDDCQNWVYGYSEIVFSNICGNIENHCTMTEWENVPAEEYTPPVNMKLIYGLLNLFDEMSKLGAVAEMCRKAKEIEFLGESVGIIPIETPSPIENESTEPNKARITSEIAESTNNTPDTSETTKEPENGPGNVPREIVQNKELPAPSDLSDIPRNPGHKKESPGIIKRISWKIREYASMFL